MRDDDVLPVYTSTSSPSLAFASSSRKDVLSVSSAVFGRNRYKFWALALILMLAFWSMLTGTVSLRWSAGDLDDSFNQEHHSPSTDDLDVLDLEEREKSVRHMWDVYNNNQRMNVPIQPDENESKGLTMESMEEVGAEELNKGLLCPVYEKEEEKIDLMTAFEGSYSDAREEFESVDEEGG